MAKINLLNSHTYVFVTIMIIAIAIISIYAAIGPESDSPSFRMNPFPQMAPTDLPDPNRSTDSCWNKLTPCDEFGNCSACSSQEYKCQDVSKDQANAKFFHFNGINVPEGRWCIPKDQNANNNCNEYSGRWLWVFDPAYCADKSTNGQCWKCECLYPAMFASSEDGCSVPVACQNDSAASNSASSGQPGSQLVSRFTTPTIQAGCVWDPTKTPDPNCQGLFQYTPYDQDKNGNPLFSCNCTNETDNQYYVQLPGDPYSCHLDPCYKYMNYTSPGYDKASNSCVCGSNFTAAPGGHYNKTCVLTTSACGSGGYADGTCQCGGGPMWPRACKSTLTGINTDQPTLPDCAAPQNALGSECFNPCEGNVCNHGGFCLSCGPDSYKSVEQCKMSELGTIMSDSDAGTIHAICDCSSAGPVPPLSKTYGGFFGPSCQYFCQKSGTVLAERVMWSSSKGNSCNCCCSQNEKSEGDVWIFSHHEVCTDGFPSVENPADPNCTPARGDCPDCNAGYCAT